jgi:hypothetical protein
VPLSNRNTVFISCGQRTDEERRLGRAIFDLVKELTPFTPFFAAEVRSVSALTTEIFQNLMNAAGFVCVMHRRGDVHIDGIRRGTRGSVFIEQEIALASFIHQMLGQKLGVAAFIEEGISLEGIREHIPFNPDSFTSSEQILATLREVLPTWTPDQPRFRLDLFVKLGGYNAPAQREEDLLVAVVANDSDQDIERYRVDVEMPKDIMERGPFYALQNQDLTTVEKDVFSYKEPGQGRGSLLSGGKKLLDGLRFPSVAGTPRAGERVKATLVVDGRKVCSAECAIGERRPS